MRLLLATLTFFISLAVLFGIYLWSMPHDAADWLTTVAGATSIVLSLIIANKLVNAPGTNFWSLSRAPQPLERSDEGSLIAATIYQSLRCFRVEESDEEGPHYFIELKDRSVLHLNGRYLASYEPHKVLGLFHSPRKFPCTDFTVFRDRYEGGVIGLRCRGAALEPELILPSFDASEQESGKLLKDGEIITSRTYEDLKLSRIGRRSS
jgi:hypothetical protein